MPTASARVKSFLGKTCIDMKVQRIYLPDWDWECTIFYDASWRHLPEVLHELRRIGCSRRHFFTAKASLFSDEPNRGFTISSFQTRSSVMLIGNTTSVEQFQNTFDHEKGHLARHICQADDIDPYGEEAQYIAGEIGQRLWKVAKDYICGCGQR